MSLLEEGFLKSLTIDGKEYRVRYQHHRPTDDKGNLLPKGGTTVASILKDDIEIKAISECSAKDTYRKKIGRIIATGRLLKALGLPRQ